MSSGVRIIAGVGAMVVGAMTGQAWLFAIGASLTVGGVQEVVVGMLRQRQEGVQQNVTSNQVALPVVYGTAKLGLKIAETRVDPADDKWLAHVGALCVGSENGSGIEGVGEVYFNERLAVNAAGQLQQPYARSPLKGGDLASHAVYLGTDTQAADPELRSRFPSEWPATSAGRGVAYLRLLLRYNQEIFPAGIPNVTAVVRGNRVYDPRDGAWKWSDNPALCVRDYLASKRYGVGVPAGELDEQSFVDAANYCDETLSTPAGSAKRFTCNGWIDTSRAHDENLADLLSACRGSLVYQGGRFRLVVRRPQLPVAFRLTEDNIIGDWRFRRAGTREAPNQVKVTFVDPSRSYQPDDLVWPRTEEANPFLAADNGFPVVQEVDLPFTASRYGAEQIAMVVLRELRADTYVELTATDDALQLQVGDVVRLSHSTPGWADKEFWVLALGIQPDGTVRLALQEYDESAYALDPQAAIDPPPGTNLPNPFTVAAPSGLVLTADASTALETQQGAVVPRIRAQWTASPDPYLSHYELQYRRTADAAWISASSPAGADTAAYLTSVTRGESYDVQLRAVNTVGAASEWVAATITVESRDGAYGLMALLSNDSHVLPADAAGAVASYAGAATTMSVYVGSTDDSAAWSYAAAPSAGVTGTLADRTYTVTGLSADTGYVDLTASRAGYPSLTVRFSVAKARQGTTGATGAAATAYWLVTDAPAIKRSTAGVYTPASLTLSARSATGTAAPVAYAGRFVVATLAGGVWTDRYTSTANESSRSYTPPAGVSAVRVRLYLAGGTTTLLDEETIPVVEDGPVGPAGPQGPTGTDGAAIPSADLQITAEEGAVVTLLLSGAVGTGGTAPLSWQYRVALASATPDWPATWETTALPATKQVLRRGKEGQVAHLRVRDAAGRISETATAHVGPLLPGVGDGGRVRDDEPMEGGPLPFGRGRDSLDDVQDSATRRRPHADYVDASGRVANVHRGGQVTPADNLFQRWVNTLDDVQDGGSYARTTHAQRDGGGRAYTGLDGEGHVVTGVRSSASMGGMQLARVLGNLTGAQVNPNPDFARGIEGYFTYDNLNSGRVLLTSGSSPDVPNGTGQCLIIQVVPGAAAISPGLGGFTLFFGPDSGVARPGYYHRGAELYFVVRAYIPAGYVLQWATNGIGDGASTEWITPNEGAEMIRDYVLRVKIGATGLFGPTGYFYLTGPDPTSALTWYVYLVDVIDVRQSPTAYVGAGLKGIDGRRLGESDVVTADPLARDHVGRLLPNLFERHVDTAAHVVPTANSGFIHPSYVSGDNAPHSLLRGAAAVPSLNLLQANVDHIGLLGDGGGYARTTGDQVVGADRAYATLTASRALHPRTMIEALAVARGIRTGEVEHGDSVVFSPVLPAPPAVVFGQGGIGYKAGLTGDQIRRVRALNLSEGGFTVEAIVTPAAANLVPQTAYFSGSDATKQPAAEAYNDAYRVHYSVEVARGVSGARLDDEPSPSSIEICIWTLTDGVNWVPRAWRSYSNSMLSIAIYDDEYADLVVDGMGAGDVVRITVEAVEGYGGTLTRDRVTWQEGVAPTPHPATTPEARIPFVALSGT